MFRILLEQIYFFKIAENKFYIGHHILIPNSVLFKCAFQTYWEESHNCYLFLEKGENLP